MSPRRLELKTKRGGDTYFEDDSCDMTFELDDAGHITHVKARRYSTYFWYTFDKMDASFEPVSVRQFKELYGK
jgi:hypothetical protein